MHSKIYLNFFLFFLVSCSPVSQKDFEVEGKSIAKSILNDLKRVQTKEDLRNLQSRLEEKYLRLADLVIISSKKGSSLYLQDTYDTKISDALLEEYRRIYQIPEGREIMEEIQSRGLTRLDGFYKDFVK